jgi:hypothetical protein
VPLLAPRLDVHGLLEPLALNMPGAVLARIAHTPACVVKVMDGKLAVSEQLP